MSITAQDIDQICGLIDDLCGVYLDASKSYLIESRLEDLMRSSGCRTYAELVTRARTPGDRALQNRIVDAMTTNETLFFRDNSPFEALKHKVVPELIDSKANTVFPSRIRIWSAACSTGQEPYSLAMILAEILPDIHSRDIKIQASDVSDAAIAKASRGWYAAHEIERGMSRERLDRFFKPETDGWRVRDELRSLVTFQRRNLLEPLGMAGQFDIVMCRNVAIYFTKDVRRTMFHRLAETLTPDGYLFVGSQESLNDLGPAFKPHYHCRATFYRPNMTGTAGTVR
jgi:chemotaxis protein methyltransferase CheR